MKAFSTCRTHMKSTGTCGHTPVLVSVLVKYFFYSVVLADIGAYWSGESIIAK